MEYLHNGNIATVAVQYSHLPSPLAFMAELDAAGDTGTSLVAEVETRLAELDGPPNLYVPGESLGTFGVPRAFTSLAGSRPEKCRVVKDVVIPCSSWCGRHHEQTK